MAVDNPTPPDAVPSDIPAQPQQGNFLTRKIWIFPLWGWVVIIGGGIAIWFFVFRKMGQSNTDQTQAGGLAIDPSSGLPYQSNGQGGLNPGGALAGDVAFDPNGNTDTLLQQILANEQQNVSPPTTTGTSVVSTTGYIQANGNATLSQIAASYGTTATDLVFNPNNAGLKSLLEALHIPFTGQKGYGTYKPQKGTLLFIATPAAIQSGRVTRGRNPGDPIGLAGTAA